MGEFTATFGDCSRSVLRPRDSQGDGVSVAVLYGLDYSHEDIAGNVWSNDREVGLDGNGNLQALNGLFTPNGLIDDWRGFFSVFIHGGPRNNDPMDNHGPDIYA